MVTSVVNLKSRKNVHVTKKVTKIDKDRNGVAHTMNQLFINSHCQDARKSTKFTLKKMSLKF